MKRDPIDLLINDYNKSVKVRKRFPLLKYKQCRKCRMKMTREPIYVCSYPIVSFGLINFNRIETAYGCQDCFSTTDDFLTYLRNQNTLVDPDWIRSRYA